MPRLPVSDRLSNALQFRNIPPDTARLIMNDMFSPNSELTVALRKETRDNNGWVTLVKEVQHVIARLRSNVAKQPVYTREIYDQYINSIVQVRRDIEHARCILVKNKADPNPNAPRLPATLADIRRMAERRNAANPDDPGPSCTSQWQTWVPPKTIAHIRAAFDIAYGKANRGKGNRARPYLTKPLMDSTTHRLYTLRKFIAYQREAFSTLWPTDNPYSGVPHHALHLCALRMAERALDVWDIKFTKDKYHALDDLLPIQWTHLLTPGMRERIRRADANPQDMTIEGLGSFFKEGVAS